jgi:hypothetical protein
MSSLPVEINDQVVIITSTEVIEGLFVLAKQADVVRGRERFLRKTRDGLHHFILINVNSEVCPMFRTTCYYF